MLTATSSPYSEFDATESNAALAAKVLSVVRDIRTQLHPSLQDSQSKAYATSSELEVSKQRENALRELRRDYEEELRSLKKYIKELETLVQDHRQEQREREFQLQLLQQKVSVFEQSGSSLASIFPTSTVATTTPTAIPQHRSRFTAATSSPSSPALSGLSGGSGLARLLSSKDEELQERTREVEEQRKKIELLQQELQGRDRENAALTQENEELKATISQLQSKTKQDSRKIEELQELITALKQNITEQILPPEEETEEFYY